MREIKLRYVYATENGYIYQWLTLDDIEHGKFFAEELPVARNLYTGLKDKNGREIYEDDILQMGEDRNAPEGRVKIEFVEGAFGFYWQFDKERKHFCELNKYPIDIFQESGMEVIGNIYENPELLK
jgi:uncharacterized phage protein (TIGR01671 family)